MEGFSVVASSIAFQPKRQPDLKGRPALLLIVQINMDALLIYFTR